MKNRRKAFAVIVLLLWTAPLLAGQFRAGAARVDITPTMSTPLAGYGERQSKLSEGVMDPVYSRSLVLEDGNKKLAIVSNDILLVLADMKQEIARSVADLKLDGILLTATHTHSGPGGYSDILAVKIAVMGKYVPEYRQFLLAQISRSIREAESNLKPAQFGSRIAQAPGYAVNRRHRDAIPPAVVDPALGLIKITELNGKTIAYLVNYAGHPTVLPASNLKISGDYAGVLERKLEARDPGAVALFCPGALGDQGPNCALNEDKAACMNRLGRGLADEAWKNFSDIALTSQVRINIFEQMVDMPEVQFKKQCWVGIKWLMKRAGKNLVREQAEIMAVQLNDTLLYGTGAELAAELGFQLKALHPEQKQMVLTHANDWLGYLLTPGEYEIGGYEACMELYGSDFAPYLVERFREMTAGVQ